MKRITLEETVEVHKTKTVYKQKVTLDTDDSLIEE